MSRRLKSPLQQELVFEKKRQRRRPLRRGTKLGRRPRPERVGCVPHLTRPTHEERHPVHVTMRRVSGGPNFLAERVRNEITRQIASAVRRGVRVVHYSIQDDHLHLMAEATDKTSLARGMQLLFSRIAMAVNRMFRRSGSMFRDRHHRHVLKSPTEVRRALVYIFFNRRKHNVDLLLLNETYSWIDEATSAMWFEDWSERSRPPPEEVERKRRLIGVRPVVTARTWLAKVGWQRGGGPIRFSEAPKTFSKKHARVSGD